jgi:DNA-binding response OmpR family regulator
MRFHGESVEKGCSVKYPALVAVVDDDEQLLQSIGGLLRSFGIEALLFQSAEEFFRAASAPIDCVIADIYMPGMDGLAMLRRLRESGSAVPVIILSALDPESTRDRALATGADAYFSKPVDTEELMNCMVQVVNARDDMDDQA